MPLSPDQLKALARKQLNQGAGGLNEVDCFACDHFSEIRDAPGWIGTEDQLIDHLVDRADPDRLAKALNKWHPVWVSISGDPELAGAFIAKIKDRFLGTNLYDGTSRSFVNPKHYDGSRNIPAD